MNILAFSGSLRKKSYNSGLIRAANQLAPQNIKIDIFDLNPIPIYNQDVENQGLPPSALDFKSKIESTDAILISTPEYNHSFSGVIKNAIDWASRPPQNSFDSKPTTIMSASTSSFGGIRAQIHLHSVLTSRNSFIMPKPEMMVTNAPDKFDSDSQLTDPQTQQRLSKFLTAFAAWTTKFS